LQKQDSRLALCRGWNLAEPTVGAGPGDVPRAARALRALSKGCIPVQAQTPP